MRPLDARTSVSGQLSPDDLTGLKAQGVTVVINNRPDNEEPGQPTSAQMAAAAEAAGLHYIAAPYRGSPTPEAVEAVRAALARPDARLHAFCRSGMRSCSAWALAEAGAGRPTEELIAAGRSAGYDLTPLFA